MAVHYVNDNDRKRNFAFKTHRDNTDIYAVNSIAFHKLGTFATAGSDGTFNFWDKDRLVVVRGVLWGNDRSVICVLVFQSSATQGVPARGSAYHGRQVQPCRQYLCLCGQLRLEQGTRVWVKVEHGNDVCW